jgi:hypothetical protein
MGRKVEHGVIYPKGKRGEKVLKAGLRVGVLLASRARLPCASGFPTCAEIEWRQFAYLKLYEFAGMRYRTNATQNEKNLLWPGN